MDTDKLIQGIAETAARSNRQNEGDYIENGILMCGKCRTPKQCEMELGGRIIKPYCMCRCEAEGYEREKEEKRKAERMHRLDMMRRTGLPDAEMRNWTFQNDDGGNEKIMDVMKRYVANFPRMLEFGKGLMLCGSVGTGKSYAAASVANALIDAGTPCMMTNFSRMVNIINSSFEGRQKYIDSLNDFDLLIIDDLAAERDTEFMAEQIMNIIDARYRAGLPLIVTTNLTAQELSGTTDIRKQRVFSRLIEMCVPITVTGRDRRKAKAAQNAEIMGLLGL